MEPQTTNNENVAQIYKGKDIQDAYICSRIQGQIDYYEKKSSESKKLYHTLSVLAIVANAAVPICSVFIKTADGNEGIKAVIAILSSLSLIATSLLTLFNARELWAKYRNSASGLTSLLHQYYAGVGLFDNMGKDDAFKLLSRLAEEHLDQESRSWSELLSKAPKPEMKNLPKD